MKAKILDGKKLASELQEKISAELLSFKTKGYRPPGLAVILVGEDPASEVYVRNKHKACEKTGIISYSFNLDKTTSQEKVLDLINDLNEREDIDGILVQLPLPDHIDSAAIIEKIDPNKDVDGFHPYNLGRLLQRRPLLRPCTPYGIMLLLEAEKLTLTGLNAVVVGVSNIVGRPMALELLMAKCTVTACHRFTKNLNEHVAQADLLVVAAGHPHLIKGPFIKEGAIVIDVGMNRMEDGHFIGDVEFEEAALKASYITPVPGGVGPMTVTVLLKNTMFAYKNHLGVK